MLRGFAIAFAVAAIGLLGAAIVLMIGDRQERSGYVLRIAAVVCFGIAVVLNSLR